VITTADQVSSHSAARYEPRFRSDST
jgi:hypothetical protein